MSSNPNLDEDLAKKVVDPDDYNRTQRFKEIHAARQRVTEFVAQMELPEDGTGYYRVEAARLAYLVALYIMELEPLIIQSDFEDGHFVPESSVYGSLREFAVSMGVKAGETGAESPSPMEVMSIYSAANTFYAKIGMDLEIKADEGDAGFDYSDILEEGPPGEGDPPEIEEVSPGR